MKKIGLFNIDGVDYMEKEMHPIGAYARMKEKSRGKDTTIGHWGDCRCDIAETASNVSRWISEGNTGRV